ncbi:hypothetical protein GS399_01560 [Pedobacter sp. HMF7647]|uniref:DoxX family membrane protein n=1 Tax=Hufsiella arboris TaxID=2695275 RepID=A0A7K1Y4Y5_9SPHI|nr:hypothetical protein [Hufsiella arboris]MXV49643.1 hypothetical protein [Hufsiella arboris]
MKEDLYLKTGRLFLGIAIAAIGIIHIASGHFPNGLLPVPPAMPGQRLFSALTGVLLTASGILIVSKKWTFQGAILAAIVWFILFLLIHLPKLFNNMKDAGEWTVVFEVVPLICGAVILIDNYYHGNRLQNHRKNSKLSLFSAYFFAVSLIAFAVLHYIYAEFIATLIPGWIPGRLFWAYFVGVIFLACAVSIIINKLVLISSILLSLMFFLWFWILHLPRVIASLHTETEWTSLFVVLAMSGISLLAGFAISSHSTNLTRRY